MFDHGVSQAEVVLVLGGVCHSLASPAAPLPAVTLTLWWAASPSLLGEGDGFILLLGEMLQQMGRMNGISHWEQRALMSRVCLFARAWM